MDQHLAVVAQLRDLLQAISPDIDVYELRGRLADIRNLAARTIVRIDAEEIARLRSNDPMPEHGFGPRQKPTVPKGLYTVDDLL